MMVRLRNIILLVGCICFLIGCNKKRQINWNVTLFKEDKNPYGAYISYQLLKNYFPVSRIIPLTHSFRYSSINNQMNTISGDSVSLLLLAGIEFNLSEREMNQLLSFVSNGNEVLVFCSELDTKMEQVLQCEKKLRGYELFNPQMLQGDTANYHALSLSTDSTYYYGMKGRSLLGYFELQKDSIDSSSTENSNERDENNFPKPWNKEVFGYSTNGVNFVRYAIGNGHLTLHAAPLALSNYFLLQKDNRHYFENILQSLPANIATIYWNDYYKRTVQKADLALLLRYPAMRWAFSIALACLLMYVLFESKRRQRIIPVIKKPANSSVSFVETVGRLYYNKGNHANLAEKMIQHFLDWVRTHYYLQANEVNDVFAHQLSIKSGLSEAITKDMVQMIEEVRHKKINVDEPYLFHLYQTIQQFYKKFSS